MKLDLENVQVVDTENIVEVLRAMYRISSGRSLQITNNSVMLSQTSYFNKDIEEIFVTNDLLYIGYQCNLFNISELTFRLKKDERMYKLMVFDDHKRIVSFKAYLDH